MLKSSTITIALLSSLISHSESVCNIEGYHYKKVLTAYNNITERYENFTETYYQHDTIICKEITLLKNQPLPTLEKGYDAKILKCKNCKIEEITLRNLDQFTELQEIYFNNSFVKKFESESFSGLRKLEKLHLEENNITEISGTVLNDTKMILVDFSRNKIVNVHDKIFKNVQIQFLNLSFNQISRFTKENLENVTILKNFDLSNNHLRHLQLGDILSQNVTLDLRYNNLHNVNFSELQGTLFLNHNKIICISKTGSLLQNLYLDNNFLKYISSNVFLKSKELTNLSFHSNNLDHIEVDAFSGLSQLKSLDLSNNKLHNIKVGTFKDLRSLKILNLSSNHLVSFPFGIFTNLLNLKTLDISNNKIKHLQPIFFSSLINLENFYISAIHLKELHIQKLLKILPNLKTINLNRNQLLCEQLLHIITVVQEHNVTLLTENAFNTKNIDGIKCIEDITKVDFENFNEETMEKRRGGQEIQFKDENTENFKDLIKEIHILTSVSICVLVFVIILIIIKLMQEFQRFTYMRKYKYRIVNDVKRQSVR